MTIFSDQFGSAASADPEQQFPQPSSLLSEDQTMVRTIVSFISTVVSGGLMVLSPLLTWMWQAICVVLLLGCSIGYFYPNFLHNYAPTVFANLSTWGWHIQPLHVLPTAAAPTGAAIADISLSSSATLLSPAPVGIPPLPPASSSRIITMAPFSIPAVQQSVSPLSPLPSMSGPSNSILASAPVSQPAATSYTAFISPVSPVALSPGYADPLNQVTLPPPTTAQIYSRIASHRPVLLSGTLHAITAYLHTRFVQSSLPDLVLTTAELQKRITTAQAQAVLQVKKEKSAHITVQVLVGSSVEQGLKLLTRFDNFKTLAASVTSNLTKSQFDFDSILH